MRIMDWSSDVCCRSGREEGEQRLGVQDRLANHRPDRVPIAVLTRGTCVAQGEPPDDDRHELADHDGDHRVELGRLPGEESHTDDKQSDESRVGTEWYSTGR